MKRFSVFFLAFITFWMSTWMVTDIHDWSMDEAKQPHPVFSAQQSPSVSDSQSGILDNSPHCGVCSYDHGGHMGQTLATRFFMPAMIFAHNPLIPTLPAAFWYSRNTSPHLRPPIA